MAKQKKAALVKPKDGPVSVREVLSPQDYQSIQDAVKKPIAAEDVAGATDNVKAPEVLVVIATLDEFRFLRKAISSRLTSLPLNSSHGEAMHDFDLQHAINLP